MGRYQLIEPNPTPSRFVVVGTTDPNYADVFFNAVMKGASNLADTTINAPENIYNIGKAAYGTIGNKFLGLPAENMPSAEQPPARVTNWMYKNGLLSTDNDPVDMPGHLIDFTGQVFGGGGINPASVARAGTKYGVMAAAKNFATQAGTATAASIGGGAAGEAADYLSDNNPYLGAVARFTGSMLGGAPFVMRNTPGQIASVSIRSLSDEQLQRAQALVDESYRNGSPITGAEAVAQVTGQNPLQDVQRVVEKSATGGPVMVPFMAARPANNTAMVSNTLDQIAPLPNNFGQTAPVLGETAQNAISDARGNVTAAVKPYYDAASSQPLSPDLIAKTVTRIDGLLDPATGTIPAESAAGKELTRLRAQLMPNGRPLTNYGQADMIYKEFRDRLSAEPLDPTAVQKTAQGTIKPIVGLLGNELENSNMALALGRGYYKNLTGANVDPLVNGPVGLLGKPDSLTMQQAHDVLMPTNPQALNEPIIKDTVATLNKQNPDAVRNFVRQNLQSIFDETSQRLVSGENQWGGAKYVAVVNGNPQQAKNLQALIESLPNGQGAYAGFRKMLDILEAQGKRQATGSQTTFNSQIADQLSGGGPIGTVLAKSLSPDKFLRWADEAYQGFKYGQNTDLMARTLTDPKSVEKLKELAQLAPDSPKAQVLAYSLLAAGRANYVQP